ncbi:hypothetical protein ILUMI_15786 [Ignelater luminosus]|uniref:receptor protein-tyrosine kinase n=1 Tax=Ignelater luminosus TaxID=2038154 RepID=A0A8K0CS84_IGNLU|nr:hypothetical protein ILUMI_15786 [Ignelater luminosus]
MGTFTCLSIFVLILFSFGINAKHLGTRQWILKLPLMEQNNQEPFEKAPYFTNIKKMRKVIVKPAGAFLVLKCKADGYPTPNITWYRNNEKPIRRLGNIQYTRWSLNLEDLTTDDCGTYKCVVCNALGCLDFNYTLDVVENFAARPLLIERPHNRTVAVGSNVGFKCRFLSDLHYHMYWMKGIPSENSTVVEHIVSEDPEILELHSVTHESEGWYTCVAANTVGVTGASAYLEVFSANLSVVNNTTTIC